MVAQLTLSIADFGLRIAEFKNHNPKLEIRNSKFEITSLYLVPCALRPQETVQ